MRKTSLFSGLASVAALLLLSASVSAQGTASAGYAYLDDDIKVGYLVGSLGYEFDVGAGWSVTPEARIGAGVKDDNIGSVKVELGRVWGPAFRATYNAPNGFYAFASVSYLNYELKASQGSFSAKDDTWEFGGGVGTGFYFNDNVGIEAIYENVDGADVLTGAVRFRF